jgi:hypothetical protein
MVVLVLMLTTTVSFESVSYRESPFVLVKDVTHAFYVKDLHPTNMERRHIVFHGKRKIIAV